MRRKCYEKVMIESATEVLCDPASTAHHSAGMHQPVCTTEAEAVKGACVLSRNECGGLTLSNNHVISAVSDGHDAVGNVTEHLSESIAWLWLLTTVVPTDSYAE